ncbi:MAG: nicotinate-nucleotide diphosphorylase (carboxylating), partial [Deltaproteobacteria bacterium]|nr:nicotinate-nucleotide diphosphorylase (carboxylating) [Candidatus Desulfobacula maris]
LETLNKIAATGVDVISCGALTHQAKAIDLSMQINS